MRVLTFNLWHGLSPTSPVLFEGLEPVSRRELRQKQQIELVRELSPDICFFQEVNPVAGRAKEFTRATEMNAVYHSDLVGLKLFGVGIPMNLNSGLLILSRPDWQLKKLKAVSLDRPGVNLVRDWGSWQLREERFALFAECLVPKWGRVLLVNLHLHHGLESTPEFAATLDRRARELELPESTVSELKSRLEAGNRRRASELKHFITVLSEFEGQYEFIVVSGDFNSSPENDLFEPLKAKGFHDAWAAIHPELPGYSFDSEANSANHRLGAAFPLTLLVEDLSFSPKVREALLELARMQEMRPRRIDYIWYHGRAADVRVEKVDLIGRPDANGLAPSDHFGVCADLDVR